MSENLSSTEKVKTGLVFILARSEKICFLQWRDAGYIIQSRTDLMFKASWTGTERASDPTRFSECGQISECGWSGAFLKSH